MLLVTVEIAPFGDLNQRRILGTMTIVNDGTGDGRMGNYNIDMTALDTSAFDQIRITKYERVSGFWKLMELALRKWNKRHSE